MLPLEVLETVRDNLLNYAGHGVGVMEMSHRSAEFEAIIGQTEADLRELLDISQDYAVLFTTGGATMQFSMVPLNLLAEGETADYIDTGIWSQKAIEEVGKLRGVHVAASSADRNYSYIPKKTSLSPNGRYLHFTSNNTVYGSQFTQEPETDGRTLVCDASSDLLHKKIDVSKYGLIYAGAQKNLGIAGVTIVIVRKDLLELQKSKLPLMLDYRTYSENRSLYNTPPTFPIYVVGEVFKWIRRSGGLDTIYANNRKKAAALYRAIDESECYQGVIDTEDRSLMNVTFRLTNRELEPAFIKEADTRGFKQLQGHRSVGGIRASIYNAFPYEGISEFVRFMQEFAARMN